MMETSSAKGFLHNSAAEQHNDDDTTDDCEKALSSLQLSEEANSATTRETNLHDQCGELSAVEKVINTVELLDAILENIPNKRLFVLQRVNKTLINHIRGDTYTAKRLHLHPRYSGQQKIYPSLIVNNSNDWLGPVDCRESRGMMKWKLFTVRQGTADNSSNYSWEDMLVV